MLRSCAQENLGSGLWELESQVHMLQGQVGGECEDRGWAVFFVQIAFCLHSKYTGKYIPHPQKMHSCFLEHMGP